jgi:thiol-disulfide isomerase/thioredoxin
MTKNMRLMAKVPGFLLVPLIVTAFAVQSSIPSLAPPARAEEGPAGFETIEPPVAAPGVAFENRAGERLTPADFRGKVILLNLWATWCAPCIRELPSLDRLNAKLGGESFEVVALSIDRKGWPVIDAFFARLGIETLAGYLDATMRATAAMGATSLPTTILIDAQGREIGRMNGPAEWDSETALALIRRTIDDGG